jgi:hypothetical protein
MNAEPVCKFNTDEVEADLERRRNPSEDHDGEPQPAACLFGGLRGENTVPKTRRGVSDSALPKIADKAELKRWTQNGIEVACGYRLENAAVLVAAFDSHKGNGSCL